MAFVLPENVVIRRVHPALNVKPALVRVTYHWAVHFAGPSVESRVDRVDESLFAAFNPPAFLARMPQGCTRPARCLRANFARIIRNCLRCPRRIRYLAVNMIDDSPSQTALEIPQPTNRFRGELEAQ